MGKQTNTGFVPQGSRQQSPGKARPKYQGIELFRVLGAFAVVLLHAAGGTQLSEWTGLTRFAVPFFAASAAYLAFLSGRRDTAQPLATYYAQRFSRLYVPFLIWTVIYIVLRIFAVTLFDEPRPNYGIEILWTGSVHHLWFLPFVLVVTSTSFTLGKLLKDPVWLALAAISMLLLSIVTLADHSRFIDPLGYTAGLSFHALPAVFLALSIASMEALVAWQQRYRSAALLLGLIVLLVPLCGLTWLGRNRSLEIFSGVAALVVGLTWTPSTRSVWIANLSGLAYGVYLSHVVFVEGIEDVTWAMRIPYSVGLALLTFVVSSICAVWLCRRISRYRWAIYLGIAGQSTRRTAQSS